jgi:hypothetical protein
MIQVLLRVSKQLDIHHYDDWYNISPGDVISSGGGSILKHYDGCMVTMLKSVFPQQDWQPWRFAKKPNGVWKNEENRRQFFNWAAKKLNVSNWDDWFNYSKDHVIALGGGELMSTYFDNSLFK